MSQWDQVKSTPENREAAGRRKPEISLKVFIMKEARRNLIRDRYKIVSEVRKTNNETIYNCVNTRLEKSLQLKKYNNTMTNFEEGVNEIYVLTQMQAEGSPAQYNFVELSDSFYFNVL